MNAVHWNYPPFHWDNPVRAEYAKASEALATGNTHTGDTLRTTIKTVTFRAGELQAGDVIKLCVIYEDSSGANANLMNAWAGTPGGTTELLALSGAASKSHVTETFIAVTALTTLRKFRKYTAEQVGSNNNAPDTITVSDLSANTLDINIGCQLVNAADTATIHAYSVSVVKKTV